MAVKFESLEKKNLSIYEFEDDLGPYEIVVDEESGDVELWYVSDVDRFFVTKMERVPSEYPARGTKDVNKRTVKYLVETLIKALQSGKLDEYLDEIEAKEMFLEVFEDEASDELIETLKSYGSIGEFLENRDDAITENKVEDVQGSLKIRNVPKILKKTTEKQYVFGYNHIHFSIKTTENTDEVSLYCKHDYDTSFISYFDKNSVIESGRCTKKDKDKLTPNYLAELLVEDMINGKYDNRINCFLAQQYFWTHNGFLDYDDIMAASIAYKTLIGYDSDKERELLKKIKEENNIDEILNEFREDYGRA